MSDDMRANIEQILIDLELKYHMTILYACEAGSRAYGLASPNSDYDIRFIYVYPREQYLRLDDPLETIEPKIAPMDFQGWELRKTLRLLHKTNPSLIEWLQSDIHYRTNNRLAPELLRLSEQYYASIAIHWHYLRMAKGNYQQYIHNPAQRKQLIPVKKYLHVARPLLKVLYLERHQALPPLRFFETLINVDLPEPVRNRMLDLLAIKIAGEGPEMITADPILDFWIEATLDRLYNQVPTATYHKELRPILDDVFLHALDR